MELKIVHNKDEIRSYLCDKDKANFMFHLNDIEDYFWDYNQFYGLYEKGELEAIAILCIEYGFPILISSSYVKDDYYQDELLKKLESFLPREMYCHLNIDEFRFLGSERNMTSYEKFYNMKLNKDKFNSAYSNYKSNVKARRMNSAEKQELIEFLESNHPDYMIEEKFLNDGLYYEVREDDKIVSVCGVFSDSKEVIQIGNVTTHVDYRRRGLSERCMYEIINNCMLMNKDIVLNVLQKNDKAYNLYTKMGFEVIGEFEEVVFE